jgi:hypothetical protein
VENLEETPFSDLDPSLSIGFYFKTRSEFTDFCTFYGNSLNLNNLTSKSKVKNKRYALFSIEQYPPDMKYCDNNVNKDFDISDEENNEKDIEEEYIFL